MPLKASIKEEISRNLEKYEGRVNHLYLDTVGRVTVGVGQMLPNKSAMLNIQMHRMANGQPTQVALQPEKEAEYENVAKQARGQVARHYKQFTKLVIKEADIDLLKNRTIDAFYSELTNIYQKAKGYPDDFDRLPDSVQMALFDMIFNLGANKITTVFVSFDAALKTGDWKKAAHESHRPQIGEARNAYIKNLLLSAIKPQ